MMVDIEDLDLTTAERAMDVVSAKAINWGRTTIVKMQTAGNHYEVVGVYTVGRYQNRGDNAHVRVTLARGNAMQRLQHAKERRTQRTASDERVTP